MSEVPKHYDLLILNGNDPVLDCAQLREYMEKWDGKQFLDLMELEKRASVLEIGCGTGRIAKKLVDKCNDYTGIDISPKTVEVAKEHFSSCKKFSFVCGDFMNYKFVKKFDLVFSTLTFMHLNKKQKALEKIFDILTPNGKVVISIDKDQRKYIDTGYNKIKVYPDDPKRILNMLQVIGYKDLSVSEVEFAYIICAKKE